MFFHFHSTPVFHRKTIVKSTVILQILIIVVIVIDLLTTIDQTLQIIIYTLPFLLHVIFSFFVKRKES